ncbi:hypothetical protein [Peterkaempfera bronchialis]|uniref:hypothetical protein n=1 Tax=Peterkaempfera bronchialis TaxID=2126346 RepID=UPI003C2AB1B4
MTDTAFRPEAAASYLDARVAATAAFLPALGELVSAGVGTVRHGADRTLYIAATGPHAAYGPRVLHSRPLNPSGGRERVVLCAVPERPDPVDVSLELLDRAFWAEGVLLAHMGVHRTGPDHWPTARIGVELRSVDPEVDPALLSARLEAWRTAVQARTADAVPVTWAAAPTPVPTTATPGLRQLR